MARAKRKFNMLKNLSIDEISLVDDPANEQARILIVKAKDADEDAHTAEDLERLQKALSQFALTGGSPEISAALAAMETDNMDMETLTKALEKAEASLATLTKRATDAEEKVAELTADNAAKDAIIAKHKEPVDAAAEEAEFLKSVPASIRKQLEDGKLAQVAIEKLQGEREIEGFITKAREIGVTNHAEVGPVLHRIAKGKSTEADLLVIESVLKAAAEQVKTSTLYKAAGVALPASFDGDPEQLLKAKADDIRKAKPSMSAEAAYDQAMSENPALYNAYISKRRSASAA